MDNSMFSRLKVAGLMFLAAALAGQALASETIFRKREKNLSGDVTGVSRTEVTIKVKTPKEETVKVPANDIVNIEWTGQPAETKMAVSDENGGRLQKAIDGYKTALGSTKATSPLFKVDMEFDIARATAKIALADPARIDEAIDKLEKFRKGQGEHYRYFDAIRLLGELYTAKRDAVKARVTFDQLAKAPWKDYQSAAKIASARLFLAENKLDEASAEYESVIAAPAEGAAEESQRQEAILGKTRVLIGQKKFDDAIKLLDEVIAKAPGDDVKVNAEAFLRKGDCLREQGNDQDAVLEYLKVDVLFASEKSAHAEALFRLAELGAKVGKKELADEARDRLKTEYENSEWAKELKGG